jgi:hypothetical protein
MRLLLVGSGSGSCLLPAMPVRRTTSSSSCSFCSLRFFPTKKSQNKEGLFVVDAAPPSHCQGLPDTVARCSQDSGQATFPGSHPIFRRPRSSISSTSASPLSLTTISALEPLRTFVGVPTSHAARWIQEITVGFIEKNVQMLGLRPSAAPFVLLPWLS